MSAWRSSPISGEAIETNNLEHPCFTTKNLLISLCKMSSKDKIVIAFDLYGTLLSTESIAKELATHFGQEQANKIAALWRRFILLMLELII